MLKGNQKKLDKNRDGKISKVDFKILKKKKNNGTSKKSKKPKIMGKTKVAN